MSLKETLENYSKSNMYPFHMPGHKRMLPGAYAIDMTEVEGVDDLHDPSEVIFEEQKRMARLFGAKESYMLVGGSTVGNIAAIYAACNEGDRIIIQRNSHKSVYNAVMLRHLKVDYIWPDIYDNGIYTAVTLEQINEAVEKDPAVKAVVITSPTYEGFHCRLKEISEYCHQKGIILIVDQAHGAHLGFNEHFTNSAVGYADITIQSLHKTLPCLTQTAAIHISGNKVESVKVRQALDIFETSSPSYVLMNSISQCLDMLEDSSELFDRYVDNLNHFYNRCGELKHLSIIENTEENKDPGKIIISTENTGITGVELATILREKYQIETELSSFAYVLAMTSFMDTPDGFERLSDALVEIDSTLTEEHFLIPNIRLQSPKKLEIYEAKAGTEKQVKLSQAIGQISASMVCIYPPGAPIIVPGEEITEEGLSLMKDAKENGLHVTGITDDSILIVN